MTAPPDNITFSEHPNPGRDRLQHSFLGLVLGLIVIAVPLQILMGLLLGGLLFILAGIALALLALPVILGLSATPPVHISAQGIAIAPRWRRPRFVAWDDVVAFKDYTLLPTADQEVERRALQGRRKYQIAQGRMLVVRGLPWPHYVVGWFAGERGYAVIAITNRTHRNYEALLKQINRYWPGRNTQ